MTTESFCSDCGKNISWREHDEQLHTCDQCFGLAEVLFNVSDREEFGPCRVQRLLFLNYGDAQSLIEFGVKRGLLVNGSQPWNYRKVVEARVDDMGAGDE